MSNWIDRNFSAPGYKQGQIASKSLLGDHIILEGVTPSKYRIKIVKGNMEVDYDKMYGINKKK